MRKLTAILALGALLYSCTETEKPDLLNLELQTSSKNSPETNGLNVIQIPSQVPRTTSQSWKILADFTPIDDVSGTYTTETRLLGISGIPCGTNLNSVTDGILTLDFDKNMTKKQAAVCGWVGTFGNPPTVEGPNPHILYSNGQNSVAISLSIPVSTFGFELHPDLFFPFDFQVDFYNGGILIGSFTRTSNGLSGGAKLFAAESNESFDYVLIQTLDNSNGFAIGQFRYDGQLSFEEGRNPFTVDVKPDTCENKVNVNSKGVIPVAILASLDLDVNDIDLSTIRLNGVEPQKSSIADLGGFYEKAEACDCDPTDFDGIMDLDLKFDTSEVMASLGEVLDGDQVTVSLSFGTNDGKLWTGEDCISIIKKGKK